MRVKSSIFRFTLAACAIASRCSTALVEPPSAITTAMAFSNAFFVMMSRGRMPLATRFITASPARCESVFFSSEIAACAESCGRLMPSASIAEAMVLAVYIPPQEPGPGIAHFSTASRSSAVICPLASAPTDSNTDTTSRSRPL